MSSRNPNCKVTTTVSNDALGSSKTDARCESKSSGTRGFVGASYEVGGGGGSDVTIYGGITKKI